MGLFNKLFGAEKYLKEQPIPSGHTGLYLKLRERTPQIRYKYERYDNREDCSWMSLTAYSDAALFKLMLDEFRSNRIDSVTVYNLEGLQVLDAVFEDVIRPALSRSVFRIKIHIRDPSIYPAWLKSETYRLIQMEQEKTVQEHRKCVFLDLTCPFLKRMEVRTRGDLERYLKVLPDYCRNCGNRPNQTEGESE